MIIFNTLHEKLPKLVLVVCCTCIIIDWVCKQWDRIDLLWSKECLEAVGPFIGHASDGNSRR